MMDTIKVVIGAIESSSSGHTRDTTREVQFEGEQLAQFRDLGTHKGAVTDTRGTTETLYKAADGRLIVHVKDWSHWQGEPTTYSLHVVTEADLGPNGRFAYLGAEAGFGRPLTLDEALTPHEDYASDEELALDY